MKRDNEDREFDAEETENLEQSKAEKIGCE